MQNGGTPTYSHDHAMAGLFQTFLTDRELMYEVAVYLIWTVSSEFGTYRHASSKGSGEPAHPAVSPEPSLLAHINSVSRGTFRQKARSLVPLNGWACAVKFCHDGMLKDIHLAGLIWSFGNYTESRGFERNPNVVYATNISKVTNFSERLKDRTLRKNFFMNSFNVMTDFKHYKVLQGTNCV